MPWQLIYTSASRGLTPGQSGFCTVARSRHMREALVGRIEQISAYNHLITVATRPATAPRIHAYRILDLRATRYHVLSRIVDAGLDFTRRTNHLAHHLIFEAHEIARLPSPAVILGRWDGWLNSWSGAPSLLEDHVAAGLEKLPRSVPLPAEAWRLSTGDAGRAAALLDPEYLAGCHLLTGPGSESPFLDLLAETLQLLDPDGRNRARCWRYSFTTFLQGEDNPADFRWRGCWHGTPAQLTAVRGGLPVIEPASLPIPTGELAELARTGRSVAPPMPPPRPARRPLSLARVPLSGPIAPMRRTAAHHGPASLAPVRQVITHRPRPPWTRFLPHGLVAVVLMLVAGAISLLLRPEAGPTGPVRLAGAAAEVGEEIALQARTTTDLGQLATLEEGAEFTGADSAVPGETVESLHDIATWCLLVAADSEDIEVGPPIPALNELLRRLLLSQPEADAIDPESIDCRWEPASFGIRTAETAKPIRLRLQLAGTGPRLEFLADEPERVIAGIPLEARHYSNRTDVVRFELGQSVRPGGLALSLRPRAGEDPAFEPFRVLVVDIAQLPPPIHLDKSHFRSVSKNPLQGLDPRLRDRVALWTLAGAWRWQTGWFYEAQGRVEPAPYLRPPTMMDDAATYDAPAVLAHALDRKFNEYSRKSQEMQGRLEEIRRDYEDGRIFDPKWPLGDIIGKNHAGIYHSFEGMIEGRKYTDSPPGVSQLTAFVRGFFTAARMAVPGPLELNSESPTYENDVRFVQDRLMELANDRRQRFPDFEMPPSDYLISAYIAFREADGIREKLRQLLGAAGDAQHALRLFPTNITRVTHVSLMIVPDREAAPWVEVIRFVDNQPEITP